LRLLDTSHDQRMTVNLVTNAPKCFMPSSVIHKTQTTAEFGGSQFVVQPRADDEAGDEYHATACTLINVRRSNLIETTTITDRGVDLHSLSWSLSSLLGLSGVIHLFRILYLDASPLFSVILSSPLQLHSSRTKFGKSLDLPGSWNIHHNVGFSGKAHARCRKC